MPQLGVVNGEEVLIEPQASLPRTIVEFVPVDGTYHMDKGVQAGTQAAKRVVSQHRQGSTHQEMLLAELLGDPLNVPSIEVDAIHAGKEKRERHGLRILICEGLV